MVKAFRAHFFLFLIFCTCSLFAEDLVMQKATEKKITRKDAALVNCLRGIIFIDSKTRKDRKKYLSIKKKQLEGFDGFIIAGVDIPDQDDFMFKMQSYLGKPVSFNQLQEIKQSIIEFYKKRGFKIADVRVPAGQEITNGVVQFIISVGKLGKVKVEGAKYFSKNLLRKHIRTDQGEEISFDRMKEDLQWLNNNPFRHVTLLYEPGENLGETDVNLHVYDRWPLRFYGGYENTGNINAGRSRYLVGVNWGNCFALDHRFNYQYMCASSLKKWQGHSYSYIAPLSWHNLLKVFGSYVKTTPDMEEDFLSKGKSWYVGVRYHIPFKGKTAENEFYFGYDFKRTNNFLSYQTELIFDTYMDISQFIIGQEGLINYKEGSASYDLVFYLSPGKMTKYNYNTFFREERDGATANYFYFDLYIDNTLYMPADFSWVLTSQFQYATGKLLPSEQLSLGGYYTVRGYQENKVISDRGILLRNEIRSPIIDISKGSKKIKNEIQLLGFVDFGWAANVDQNILSKDSTILASTGLGFRYNLMNYITFRFDYGWQLDTIHRVVDDSNKHSRFHLGLVASY